MSAKYQFAITMPVSSFCTRKTGKFDLHLFHACLKPLGCFPVTLLKGLTVLLGGEGIRKPWYSTGLCVYEGICP